MRSSSGRKKRFVENAPRLVLLGVAAFALTAPCTHPLFIYTGMKNVHFLCCHNSVRPALRCPQSKPANSLIDKMQRSCIPPRIVSFNVGIQNGLLMTQPYKCTSMTFGSLW